MKNSEKVSVTTYFTDTLGFKNDSKLRGTKSANIPSVDPARDKVRTRRMQITTNDNGDKMEAICNVNVQNKALDSLKNVNLNFSRMTFANFHFLL